MRTDASLANITLLTLLVLLLLSSYAFSAPPWLFPKPSLFHASKQPAPPSSALKKLVAFGDSLTDNGNGTYLLDGKLRPASPPYYDGRWSNGPIWAEYLANALGADLLDYAHGGSTTDNTFIQGWIPLPNGTHLTVPSLHDQISTHLTTPNTTPTSPQTLYTIWSGANDFFQAAPHTAFSLITHEFWTHVASNIRDAAGRLRQSGARTIIVFTLAPIHHSPAGLNLTAIERLAVETLIKATNHDIKKDVSPIAHVYDPYAFFEEVKKDPRQYGFSDTTSPCLENWWAYNKIEVMNLSAPPIVCESPGTYVFWDEVHPTTAGHRVLGQHVKEFIDRGYTSGAMRGVVAAVGVWVVVVVVAGVVWW